MSDAMFFMISLAVTILGLVTSYGVAKRRGVASGLRGTAWSLVPIAAYLTGVTEFVADLAFSVKAWTGVAVAGLAVLLYLVSGMMLRRGAGGSAGRAPVSGGARRRASRAAKAEGPRAVEKSAPQASSGLDPDLADIEEILRRRGIH